jgi:hypothetical protein
MLLHTRGHRASSRVRGETKSRQGRKIQGPKPRKELKGGIRSKIQFLNRLGDDFPPQSRSGAVRKGEAICEKAQKSRGPKPWEGTELSATPKFKKDAQWKTGIDFRGKSVEEWCFQEREAPRRRWQRRGILIRINKGRLEKEE